MPNGTLITQLPCVSWLIGCAILGISEILAARRGYAQGSISTLIWPTATGGFLGLANLLAIWMLRRFRSVQIQASVSSDRELPRPSAPQHHWHIGGEMTNRLPLPPLTLALTLALTAA